jgi:hypothetical protein
VIGVISVSVVSVYAELTDIELVDELEMTALGKKGLLVSVECSTTFTAPVNVPPPRHIRRDVIETAAVDLPLNSSATLPAVLNICCEMEGTVSQTVFEYTSCALSAPGRRSERSSAARQLSTPPRRPRAKTRAEIK